MIDLLARRHTLYNETRAYLWELEKAGRAVVIAPTVPLKVSRFERRRAALDDIYSTGRRDLFLAWDGLQDYLARP